MINESFYFSKKDSSFNKNRFIFSLTKMHFLKKLVLLSYLFINVSKIVFSQDSINFYYPWNTRIESLEVSDNKEAASVFLDGENYRIIKIEKFQGTEIKYVKINSKNTNVRIYELPILSGKDNKKVLDLINPLYKGSVLLEPGAVKYFLLEFKGVRQGTEKVAIYIATNKKTYLTEQLVAVSSIKKEHLNLNVWSYFNYSYLVSDLKTDVINDLQRQGVTSLVIPPKALPLFGSVSESSKQILSNYIKGTEGKFQYYILYFQFYKDFSRAMDKTWQGYFLSWYRQVAEVFKAHGIAESRIVFYPFDEPEAKEVGYIRYFRDFYRKQGLKNKLFVTVGKPEVFDLLQIADIAQVYTGRPGLLEQLKSVKNVKSEIWLYEIRNSGRYSGAKGFRNMGIKAFYLNGNGVGVWNYADANGSIDEYFRKNFLHLEKGSWEIPVTRVEKDYSLIYRKGNTIYSSLSWKGLTYGMDEYTFLKYYRQRKGEDATTQLIKDVLDNKISEKEWEKLKGKLLNEYIFSAQK